MVIFNSVLPSFLLIALGYWLKRINFADERVQDFMNKLAYNLILPCMIFASIYKLPFKEVFDLKLIAGLYSVSIVVYLLCIISARFMEPFKRGAFVNSAFRTNIAYIGFPIVYSLYGSHGLGKLSVVTGFVAPFVITLAILYLKYGDGIKDEPEKPFAFLFKDPLISVSIISLLISYFEIRIPQVLFNTIDMLSMMGSPMMLIAVGAGLSVSKILYDRVIISYAAFIKLILLPALSFVMFKYIFNFTDAESLGIGVLTYAFPTALSSHVVVARYKSDAELTAAAITVTTILSLFTISGWVYILTLIK